MASFNKVILVGNLTRDPELRSTPNGTSVCRFALAVSRQFRNSDGSAREEVCFVEVDSFGKQAETIARYMVKGRPILVEGRLRLDQWESQNGEKRSRLMVVAESFQFLGSNRSDGDNFDSEGNSSRAEKVAPKSEKFDEGDDVDEEIPF